MKNILEFVAYNWYLFILVFCIIAFLIILIDNFIKLPTENKKIKIREWLKMAVNNAEERIGSGNGQTKLLLVYNWFTKRFPITAVFMDFGTFKNLVDEVLETIEDKLD